MWGATVIKKGDKMNQMNQIAKIIEDIKEIDENIENAEKTLKIETGMSLTLYGEYRKPIIFFDSKFIPIKQIVANYREELLNKKEELKKDLLKEIDNYLKGETKWQN